MTRRQKSKTQAIPSVVFRPDGRNGSLDYRIPKNVAEDLFQRGIIWGDATNGGYMPNPASNYNVRQHKLSVKA